MNSERWQRLMVTLDAPSSLGVFADLQAAYAEPHRHYHTSAHIEDCLEQLDQAAALAEKPDEVELALWFHDAIYDPTSSQNELKSAEWARAFLESIQSKAEQRVRIFEYIMATKHDAKPTSNDSMLVVDIDLSILGREPSKYSEFEENVRKEYKWVPLPIYRRKRSEILAAFSSRRIIYNTEHFRDRYESQARKNIQSAIEALRK